MPVTNVSHDIDALTLTITAEFAAPPSADLADLCRSSPARKDLGSTDVPGDSGRP